MRIFVPSPWAHPKADYQGFWLVSNPYKRREWAGPWFLMGRGSTVARWCRAYKTGDGGRALYTGKCVVKRTAA